MVLNRKYKAFLIYAYVFIFIYMLNSLITWLFLRMKLSWILGTAVEAVLMVLGLYWAFVLLMKRYYGVEDKRKLAVAWLFHFVPFILSSFLLFFALIKAVPNPSFAVFVYLNGAIFLLFITYKFAVEKFIEKENG